MFKNIIKITLRNFIHQKTFSLLNIFGLTLGLTAVMLLLIFLKHELSFDSFHEDIDDIYVAAREEHSPDGIDRTTYSHFPLGEALSSRAPEIEMATRYYNMGNMLFKIDNLKKFEENVWFVDSTFLSIFTFPLKYGNEQSALIEKNSIVLSESLSEELFGNEDPVGKSIYFQNQRYLTVTGVAEEIPAESSIDFNALISYSTLDTTLTDWDITSWGTLADNTTFVKLHKNASVENLEKNNRRLIMEASADTTQKDYLYFIPFRDVHLEQNLTSASLPNTGSDVFLFGALIAILILGIAIINFMNLSTARSSLRVKEVGVRKVLGAMRNEIQRQFIFESVFYAVLSFILSVALVEVLLGSFSQFIENELTIDYVRDLDILLVFLIISIFTGILAGSYPAFFLSKHSPIQVLRKKNSAKQKGSGIVLRQSLVVFQFCISFILIAGTLIIIDQLSYMRNTPVGFDESHVLNFSLHTEKALNNKESIGTRLTSNPAVLGASFGFKPPIGRGMIGVTFYPDGRETPNRPVFNVLTVDTAYLNLFNLQLIAGRNFSTAFAGDYHEAIILNETGVRKLGYEKPEDIIGKIVATGLSQIDAEVIGVVKDFHVRSLHTPIEPLAMYYFPELFYSVSVKIKNEDIPTTLAYIEDVWNEYQPEYPFEYRFVSETIQQLYDDEEKMSEMIGLFSFVAIFTACLGLFGLAAFTAERKTKEIGIRKVLGATASNVVFLLSKEFSKLVLISSVIAAPIAYYIMNRWLENFAFHITIGFEIYILVLLIILVITFLTVSYHALKAAYSNPVKSLRSE